MTITYTTFKSVATLTTAMEAAVTASKTLQADIQNVAFGILCHAVKHGDYTLATRFVNELADGVRRKALVEYFILAGLKINDGGDGFSDWMGADFIKAKAEELKTTMWWTLKPEQPFKGFDLMAEVQRVLKRAEKMQKEAAAMPADDAKREAIKVDVNMLTALKSLTAQPAPAAVQ